MTTYLTVTVRLDDGNETEHADVRASVAIPTGWSRERAQEWALHVFDIATQDAPAFMDAPGFVTVEHAAAALRQVSDLYAAAERDREVQPGDAIPYPPVDPPEVHRDIDPWEVTETSPGAVVDQPDARPVTVPSDVDDFADLPF